MHLVPKISRVSRARAEAESANDAEVGGPADKVESIQWSVDEIVKLHMIMLDELARLADPKRRLRRNSTCCSGFYGPQTPGAQRRAVLVR